MRSPFPGMDPYIEGQVWKGFHNKMIAALGDELVARLRPRYVVDVEDTVYLVRDDESAYGVRSPDIAISQPEGARERGGAGGVATAAIAQSVTLTIPLPRQVRQLYLKIRRLEETDAVTLIELLSPWNKTGDGRTKYLEKRSEILRSSANLVEIDLSRGGERLPTRERLPAGDFFAYVVRQFDRPRVQVFPWTLRDPLPRIPIPLAEEDPECIVDLQAIFATVFDRSGYDYGLNRSLETVPPLSPSDAEWVREKLALGASPAS